MLIDAKCPGNHAANDCGSRASGAIPSFELDAQNSLTKNSHGAAKQEISSIPTAIIEPDYSIFITVRARLLRAEEQIRAGDWTRARESVRAARAAIDGNTPALGVGLFARGGLTPRQIKRLEAHVESNLSVAITLGDLARVAGLSYSHFCRAFRESFGRPPQAYVKQRRIERAKAMMLETDQPLAQIALECGLSDQAALSKVFRRLIGESPAMWRRLHRA